MDDQELPSPPEAPEPAEPALVRPLDDRYFVGFWNHYPNFGCPHCGHKTIKGPDAIDEHIYDDHPEIGDFDDASDFDHQV